MNNAGSVVAGGTAMIIRGDSTIGSTLLQDRNVLISTNPIPINDGQSTFAGNLINLTRFGIPHSTTPAMQLLGNTSGQTIGLSLIPNFIGCTGRAIELNAAALQDNILFTNFFIPGSSNCQPIDLGGNGVTPNDPDDADSGPNGLQNFPVITAASRISSSAISVTASLDVGHAAPVPYDIALYASGACSSHGHGPGERLIGVDSQNISTAAESFSFSLNTVPLAPGTVITATATRAGVGTSEMSACFPLDPPPLVVNGADDSNDGSCDATHCSLREAINAANASSNPNQIHFAIASPASGEIAINLSTPLPTIVHPLAIDGYTQAGSAPNSDPEASNAQLRIRVHGSTRHLGICADGVSVSGIAFTGATQAALSIGTDAFGLNCSRGDGARIAGNYFGLATDGFTASPNVLGIRVSSAVVTIGGSNPAGRNLFAASTRGLTMISNGIDGSQVLGNLFGTDASGLLDRGNVHALALDSSSGSNSVQIGLPDSPNRFRFNDRVITVNDVDDAHRFSANSFVDNDQLAIDLLDDGVSANDPDDLDSGPNGLQNFPLLTAVERPEPTLLRVRGSLDVPPGPAASYRIEVYASRNCDGSGHGEGEFYVGAADLTLTNNSAELFELNLVTDVDLDLAPVITATATSAEGSSEFSACLEISDELLADGFE